MQHLGGWLDIRLPKVLLISFQGGLHAGKLPALQPKRLAQSTYLRVGCWLCLADSRLCPTSACDHQGAPLEAGSASFCSDPRHAGDDSRFCECLLFEEAVLSVKVRSQFRKRRTPLLSALLGEGLHCSQRRGISGTKAAPACADVWGFCRPHAPESTMTPVVGCGIP